MRRLIGDIPPFPVMADQTLADIVCKACHPDPAHRFQSAGGLREALIMYLHERDSRTGDGQTGNERNEAPVKRSDHPPNPPDKPRPRFPVKPILFAACAAAFILVIAAAKGALSFGQKVQSRIRLTAGATAKYLRQLCIMEAMSIMLSIQTRCCRSGRQKATAKALADIWRSSTMTKRTLHYTIMYLTPWDTRALTLDSLMTGQAGNGIGRTGLITSMKTGSMVSPIT